MQPKPLKIANHILDAIENDYAGMPECDDREGKAWRKLFKKADELGVLDLDLLEAMMLQRIGRLGDANLCLVRPGRDVAAPAPCTFEMSGDTAVLRLGNLDSTEAADLLASHCCEAASARLLVFDLRGCSGGLEQAAYPLLDWLFDEDTDLSRILPPQTVLTKYTAASCDARETQISQLKTLIAGQGGAETTAWLDQSLEAVRQNRGKGFVEETAYPAAMPITAGPTDQKVALLTDGNTADAAEWLALVAKQSPRTVQVGQATRGNLDYSNPVSLSFGDSLVFVYPMSKTVEAAAGRGMRGVGVQPDVAVAPDADPLEAALGI